MKTIGLKNNKKDINKLKKLIVETLDANKAEDIEIIDLEGKTELASFMIIATGRADRHVKSMADNLLVKFRNIGQGYVVEGMDKKDWVLVDTFDIIVHLFKKETREQYDLESLWKK